MLHRFLVTNVIFQVWSHGYLNRRRLFFIRNYLKAGDTPIPVPQHPCLGRTKIRDHILRTVENFPQSALCPARSISCKGIRTRSHVLKVCSIIVYKKTSLRVAIRILSPRDNLRIGPAMKKCVSEMKNGGFFRENLRIFIGFLRERHSHAWGCWRGSWSIRRTGEIFH